MKDFIEKIELGLKSDTKLWQTTLDAIKESIFLINLEYNILQCNRATLDIFGKTNYNEIIGQYCWELVHGTSGPVEWCPVMRMLESGHREATIRKINERWVEIAADPVFNDTGEISGAVHIITDITSYKTLSNELEAILDMIPAIIFRKNRKGEYTQVNQAFADALNLNKEDIVGKTPIDIFPLDQAEILHEGDLKVIRSGKSQINNDMYVNIDGEQRRLVINKIPQFDADGYVIGLIGITQIAYEQELIESENKYRQLIENSLEGVWVIDEDANTTLINPSMANILGYEVNEMKGRTLFDFTAYEDIEATKKTLERRREGIKEEIEKEFIRKDGTKVFTRLMTSPIFDNDGKYKGAIAFVSDITNRKKTENLLRESEEKFRTLFEIVPASIVVLDLNGNIVLYNRKFCDLHGVKNPELLKHKSIRNFFSAKDLPKLKESMTKSLKGISRGMNQYTMLKEDGTEFQAEAISIGIKDKNGEITGLIGVAQDITNRKKADQELKESEEIYRTLTEQSFLGIAILQDDKIQYVNEQLAHTVGYTVEEILAWEKGGFLNFIHPDYRKFIAKQARKKQLGESDVINQYQFRGIKKNGDIIWLEVFSKTINYRGKPADFVTIHDITDGKISEQKLKESEEKFRTISEQSFMGILITVDDEIEYVNNILLQIFEYSREEITNWTKDNIIEMIHPDDLQFLREYREKLRRRDPNVKPYYSYRVFTKSGNLKWVDQFSTVINYKGKTAELVTFMDITEKKIAEQELVKLNSLKSELMRRTSHELKTPLVSIKGYSDLLLSVHKEKLDNYVLASIVEIKKGCERLESLIKDILNTAELESGAVQLNKIVDDLSFFIKLSVMELQGLAKLRNQTINLNIPGKLITSFEPEQMHQVISNLINNAIKYTPSNGIIEISSEIKDHHIIVSIKDSGIGLTKEEKERLFTQFGKIERYGQGLDIISDGSGLGLYISKKIVELHGGEIWVESEGRNKGSTFYFSIPIINENPI
ncbi:MAG: PAS domain S-box protein [Candidatus Hodarchaeota archaeon]